jgi:glucarate dehydratase
MKIVDMRVTPVAIADPPLRSSYGLHAPYALRTVIELVSEDGLVGIAEAHGGEQPLADFRRAVPLVVGTSAFDLARVANALDRELAPTVDDGRPAPPADRSQSWILPGNSRSDVALRVFAAIETAALDLVGNAIGRPLFDLLGGRVRETVPFSAYLFYKHPGGGGEGHDAREDRYGAAMDPGAIVAQARQMIAEYGFQSVKLKAGVLEPAIEIETILALRDALGPEIPLRIDPNAAWSVATSLIVARRLAAALEYLEDPTPGLAGMGELRQAMRDAGIETPLASNVAVTSFADIPEAIDRDAVQVVLGDHHYWGGPRAIIQLGRLCETFGLGLSMHSNSHLGISLLAMGHVAAATRQLTFACDTHYPWQDARDEVIIEGRIPIEEGAIRPPDRPGLGARLDYDALARGRERYERCGYRRRDDEAEMQRHVRPDWHRVVPTW